MTNNTLFCGIALVVIGLASYWIDTPNWDAKVNQFADAHDAAVDKHAADPAATPEPRPNKKEEELAKERAKGKTHRRDPNHRSLTALIPSGLGLLLLAVVGVVIYRPDLRKHAMHFAALAGAAAVGGGVYALTGGLGEFNELNDANVWAGPTFAESWLTPLPSKPGDKPSGVSVWEHPKVRSGALTALVGLIYVVLAVKSFIDARKAMANPTPAAQ